MTSSRRGRSELSPSLPRRDVKHRSAAREGTFRCDSPLGGSLRAQKTVTSKPERFGPGPEDTDRGEQGGPTQRSIWGGTHRRRGRPAEVLVLWKEPEASQEAHCRSRRLHLR